MKSEARKKLIDAIVTNSEAENWDDAVTEWDVCDEITEDWTGMSQCVCGQSDIRYLYRIRNHVTGHELYPIGSCCIEKFGRTELNRDAETLRKLILIRHAVENNETVTVNKKYFSRHFISYLYEHNAFRDSPRNFNDAEFDYKLLTKAFNSRSISENEANRVREIIDTYVIPFAFDQEPELETSYFHQAKPDTEDGIYAALYRLLSISANQRAIMSYEHFPRWLLDWFFETQRINKAVRDFMQNMMDFQLRKNLYGGKRPLAIDANNFTRIFNQYILPHLQQLPLDQDPSVQEQCYNLLRTVKDGGEVVFSGEVFSARLISYLSNVGAFAPNRYNNNCAANDARFLQDMIRYGKSGRITSKQAQKIKAVLGYQVIPFLRKKLSDIAVDISVYNPTITVA